MPNVYVAIPTGAKSVSELKFKAVIHKGRQAKLPYEEIIKVLNSGKAFIIDPKIKKTTITSGVSAIKNGLNKGLVVKYRQIEDSSPPQYAYVPVSI
jgi:hypothetical protein